MTISSTVCRYVQRLHFLNSIQPYPSQNVPHILDNHILNIQTTFKESKHLHEVTKDWYHPANVDKVWHCYRHPNKNFCIRIPIQIKLKIKMIVWHSKVDLSQKFNKNSSTAFWVWQSCLETERKTETKNNANKNTIPASWRYSKRIRTITWINSTKQVTDYITYIHRQVTNYR